MITENTVFVLGAGASCPYGYPTGMDLRNFICEDNNFKQIYSWYLHHKDFKDIEKTIEIVHELKLIDSFINSFKYSHSISIDKFININKKDQKLFFFGKLAILLSILDYERQSKIPEKLDKENKKQDWFSFLFGEMLRNISNDSTFYYFSEKNKISFITFNYDRSLEYFLIKGIIETFKSSNFENRIFTKDIKLEQLIPFSIYHVYGKIGNLPWEDVDNKGINFHYKNKPYEYEIKKLISNINIIYEDRKNNKDIEKMIEQLKTADKIFFLGFGFDEDNLEVLNIPKSFNKNQKIYANGYGLFREERNKISKILQGTDLNNFIITEDDCLSLLRKYLK